MGRIGIYGGSFNPPNLGHIRAAQFACKQLELEKLSEDTDLPDDVVILDDSSVTLTLTYSTGARVRKAASHALAMELFRILSPYLIK